MIPILYSSTETEFVSNGIGRLAECVSCIVTEEYNGQYELELQYPVNGKYYLSIISNSLVLAKPSDTADPQPFRIYRISRPLNGIVTFNAKHLSYDLDGIPVSPFEATGITRTFEGLLTHSMITNPFSWWSDISNDQSSYSQTVPASFRTLLGGVSGSVLDVFGGEYEWDKWCVRLHAHRGSDQGVAIRYGKNLTDITQEESIESTYTGVIAYYQKTEGTVVIGSIQYVDNYESYPKQRILVLDKSSDYSDSIPAASDLTKDAADYITANNVGIPSVNLEVSFIALWQTENYKDIAPLERVSLCDTVHVYFEKLGVSSSARVIKTEYDCLKERYTFITIGDAKASLSETLTVAAEKEILPTVHSTVSSAVTHATDLLSGGLGGHIVISRNSAGEPNELLFLDTDDISTAVNVWRYNSAGWGVSHNGYNGPYTMAATLDGGFVADFITTGTLSADLIKIGDRTLTETMDEISKSITTVSDATETNKTAIEKNAENIALKADSSTVTKMNDDLQQEINDTSAAINVKAGDILSEVAQTYVSEDDLTAYKKTVQTALEQRDDSITAVASSVTTLNDKMSGVQDTADNVNTYLTFNSDGLEMGKSDSPFKMDLTNTELDFTQNGTKVTYLSNNRLYVTNGTFLNELRIGDFAFMPRANGSLDFKKVG